MGYAICRIEKIKTKKEMSDRYKHNMRIFDVYNADPLLSSQNEYLVDQLLGRSYEDICADTVRQLRMSGAITREIRKDAVKGYEVFLGFSHEDSDEIDLEEWANRSVEWLRKQFNPPDNVISYTNKEGLEVSEQIDNVKSVVLHMDESTPHIHAFIVPVDEHGHLNARYYTNGRNAMSKLQDSYAHAMEPFGLWRGEKHHIANHIQSSAYYNRLLQAVESTLPKPNQNESIEDYYKRADNAHKTAMVHQRDSVVKSERKLAQKESSLYNRTVDIARRETEFSNQKFLYELEQGRKELLLNKLADAIGEPDMSEGTLDRINRDVTELRTFKEALRDYPNQEKARDIEQSYNEMLNWQRSRKTQEKRKEQGNNSQER